MSENKIPKKKVMVVEDESIVAMDIKQGLIRLGYEVPIVVASGEEAIRCADIIRPDLILMDIQLKGKIDGIEAAKEIHRHINLPVIFLTAYADELTLQRAKKAEPYGYLLKPFEETELHTAIEVVLQKHKKVEEVQDQFIKELVLSEERFKIFVNSVFDYAIFMLDVGGNIVSWNSGAHRILGYNAREVIGKNISIFLVDKDNVDAHTDNSLKRAKEEGQSLDEGWRLKNDGTKIWAHVTTNALYDRNKKLIGYGKVVHDMTKTKAAEDLLKNTVKARDEFLSIASHELKTPLTSLLLQVQTFQKSQKRNDEKIYEKTHVDKLVDLTHKQTLYLSRLVEDMLDISRIRTGKFSMKWTHFDMNQLLKDIIERMTPQFIEAKCGSPEFIAPSYGINGDWDKERIEQVMRNLLTNCLKYAGGFPVTITLKDLHDKIQIEVRDSGSGIEKENHEKIFERFERAVDFYSISGMGLGLYISRQIVESHNGKIWVESEIGKGANFCINIPRNCSNQKEKAEVSPIL